MINKIILIGGYVAAGKTAFAHKLSRELSIPCYEKDTIDEVLNDAFGAENNVVEMGSGDAAFALMLHIAERLLMAQKTCILEGNFDTDEIKIINGLLDKYECLSLLFVLKGDPEVMFNRYLERDRLGERHWIHYPGYFESEEYDNFKNFCINIMPEKLGLDEAEAAEKIIADATHFDKINYDDLFAAAKRFIAGK